MGSQDNAEELTAGKDEETEGLVYFHPNELRTKDFNKFVDRLLTTGDADETMFANLTPVQRHVYSVINRACARLQKLTDTDYGRFIDGE